MYICIYKVISLYFMNCSFSHTYKRLYCEVTAVYQCTDDRNTKKNNGLMRVYVTLQAASLEAIASLVKNNLLTIETLVFST